MDLWGWIQESRLGLPSWSSSDSTFCTLRRCPGLLGVSASRLLCFSHGRWPLCCGAYPISPPFSIAQVPSATVPNWICHQIQPSYLSNSFAKSFFVSLISSAKLFSRLSHALLTALLTLKLAKPMIKKMASSPVLKLEPGALWDSYKL